MSHAQSLASRRRRRAVAMRPSARRGMTLIEIIVAMMILTGVVMMLGGFTAKFSHANSQAHLVIAANELASQRLDTIRQQATYGSIDLLKTSSPDTIKYDFMKFARQTTVLRIGGGVTDSVDYKLVTVTVTAPGMRKTVTKSTAIAAF